MGRASVKKERTLWPLVQGRVTPASTSCLPKAAQDGVETTPSEGRTAANRTGSACVLNLLCRWSRSSFVSPEHLACARGAACDRCQGGADAAAKTHGAPFGSFISGRKEEMGIWCCGCRWLRSALGSVRMSGATGSGAAAAAGASEARYFTGADPIVAWAQRKESTAGCAGESTTCQTDCTHRRWDWLWGCSQLRRGGRGCSQCSGSRGRSGRRRQLQHLLLKKGELCIHGCGCSGRSTNTSSSSTAPRSANCRSRLGRLF